MLISSSTVRIFIVGLFALLLAACTKVSKENYDRVQAGMPMEEVYSILGEPTDKTTKGIGGLSGTSVFWEKDGIKITVLAVNGKVTAKKFIEEKSSQKVFLQE